MENTDSLKELYKKAWDIHTSIMKKARKLL